MSDPRAEAMLADFDLDHFARATLAEDFGRGGDVTSRLTIPAGTRLEGAIVARDDMIVAGLDIAALFFLTLDGAVSIEKLVEDGARVAPNSPIMRLAGDAHAILGAERSALNTLQHLSGIATLTRRYADAIAGTGCILLDTRKTLPGLRALEKYATRMGGAKNHRIRLDDGLLIKDNHVAIAGGITQAVSAAKSGETSLAIQVEVDRLDQIEPALAAGADRLLCDNMGVEALRQAVAIVAGRVPIEASGGIRLDTIRMIAETGVTYASAGRITQSAPAADIGLDIAHMAAAT